MKKKIIMSFALVSALTMGSFAQLTWTGAVDSDVTNDGNWTGGSVAGILDASLAEEIVFVNAGTAPIGPEQDLQPSWGVTAANSFTVDGVLLDTAGNDGIAAGSVVITNGGAINIFFINTAVSMYDTSTLTLLGGGDPLPAGSTVDLVSSNAVLQFENETWEDFQSEHQSQVTSWGSRLEFGSNPEVLETGDNAFFAYINGGLGVQIQVVYNPQDPPPESTPVWTGAVDYDITNDANWSESVVGITDHTLAADLVFTNAGAAPIAPDIGGDPQVRWGVADTYTITVDGVLVDSTTNDGVTAGVIDIINGGSIRIFFVENYLGAEDCMVNVDGTSSLNLLGGGNPISEAQIHLAFGAQLTLVSLEEFTEQGDEIFVDGVSYNEDNSVLSFEGSTATALGEPPLVRDPIGTIVIEGPIAENLMALSWDTSLDQIYNVETNANMVSPNWGISDTTIGTGGGITVTTTVDQVQMFYKVTTP